MLAWWTCPALTTGHLINRSGEEGAAVAAVEAEMIEREGREAEGDEIRMPSRCP
jgi:hypothetical protein